MVALLKRGVCALVSIGIGIGIGLDHNDIDYR